MLLCNPIRHIWLIKILELRLKRKMTPGTLCSLKALPRPPKHLRLAGPCWLHTRSTGTRLYGSCVADEETVGQGGEDLPKMSVVLKGQKDLKIVLGQELPWGLERGQCPSAMPGARASRSAHSDAPIIPTRDNCQALGSAVLHPPRCRTVLAGSCGEGFLFWIPACTADVLQGAEQGEADGLI